MIFAITLFNIGGLIVYLILLFAGETVPPWKAMMWCWIPWLCGVAWGLGQSVGTVI